MNGSKIKRLLKLLTVLQSGQEYTADGLAKMFSISRRTIFRDLDLLRAIGVPCFYDNKKGCYSTRPHFFFSCENLSRQEAFAILLLVKAAKSFNFPFWAFAAEAAQKIASNLDSEAKQYCCAALKDITIGPVVYANTRRLEGLFNQIINAIVKKRVLHMRYALADHNDVRVIELKPYHLRYVRNMWYVIGKSNLGGAVAAFNLNHIRELKIQSTLFSSNDKFDIDEYLGRAWEVKPQGRLYCVKLKFAPDLADDVAATQWHSTQKTACQADGSLIVEFRLDGLDEIKWWILGYGAKVEILQPKILREMVTEMAQRITLTAAAELFADDDFAPKAAEKPQASWKGSGSTFTTDARAF